ncbi:hypothetical protein THAOC_09111 [Thalassiosira oceanica]|uniref:Uncharacterized protein n=1 Tax=Thalassiosira oceanica TaxID=159749 RepID=K0TGL3_THAOC|nr:hypothetical protein THAOC_09111 [Thalassiosira oceanica]|eukprot:EJK69617.1 hypothetical protein THAOC_09111 [Thalassiosira oceanica]
MRRAEPAARLRSGKARPYPVTKVSQKKNRRRAMLKRSDAESARCRIEAPVKRLSLIFQFCKINPSIFSPALTTRPSLGIVPTTILRDTI